MKKIFVVFLPIVFTFLGLLLGFMVHYRNDNDIPSAKTEVIKKSRSLSMMLETGAGTGEYEQTTRDSWPTEGYVFNPELSKCENGGMLSWNDENNTVVMTGSTSDKCYVYFDKVTFLADHIKSKYTGTQGGNGLYLHNSSLANGAGDNSYRYAGGDYVLTSKATNAGLTSVITASREETTGVINFYCDGTKLYVGSRCSSSKTHHYTLQYDSSNTQYGTYLAVLSKAVNDGYLTKDNVNNFVCFGSNIEVCPIANLYRIIGVFGSQVKLIKYDYATSAMLGINGDFSFSISDLYSGDLGENPSSHDLYSWNSENSSTTYNETSKYNVWSYSHLNTINLNTNYITYLNDQNNEWAEQIATTTWKVGGNAYANIVESPMNTAYQNEIVTPAESTTYNAKIGLMYVSDYGYAASPTYWTYLGYNLYNYTIDYRAAKSNNWLYGGVTDWTITRLSSDNSTAVYLDDGFLSTHYGVDHVAAVRPTFYLNSNVVYDKGSGTSSDPYRIKL